MQAGRVWRDSKQALITGTLRFTVSVPVCFFIAVGGNNDF